MNYNPEIGAGVEQLRQLLPQLTPQEDWSSFQEDEGNNLRDRIYALLQTQGMSNQFTDKLLGSPGAKEASMLLREDGQGSFVTLGADPELFREVLQKYPAMYPEYSAMVKKLLKEDNMISVLREYGTIPVLSNLSALKEKDMLSEKQFDELINTVYSPSSQNAIIALNELTKTAASSRGIGDMIRTSMTQGLVSMEDLTKREDDTEIITKLLEGEPPRNKYESLRIEHVYGNLKGFLETVGDKLREEK